MATYKFEQFDIEIKNPLISANEDSIQMQVSKNTISVDITLETSSAKMCVLLDDIKVGNLSYEGYDNLIIRVVERLKDFEI
jgi:hypothetical protein